MDMPRGFSSTNSVGSIRICAAISLAASFLMFAKLTYASGSKTNPTFTVPEVLAPVFKACTTSFLDKPAVFLPSIEMILVPTSTNVSFSLPAARNDPVVLTPVTKIPDSGVPAIFMPNGEESASSKGSITASFWKVTFSCKKVA